MPLKRTFLFLLSLLIIISPFFAVNLSAAEPLMSYASDISRPVKVGVYENEPKIFTDKNGNVSGFWPDIINNIAASEGWEIEWVHGSWEECLTMLANGEIDIMPDVTYTEERAQLYDFSGEALLVSWSRIYTARGVTIQSILDLEGKTVAVLKGSVNVEGPEGIKELVNAFDVDCSYMELDSYIEVFEAADNGQADAAVVNKDFGNSHAADYNIEMTGIIFQPSQIYFAFAKDTALAPLLIETVDNYISDLKADENSVYYIALEKWLSVKAIEKAVIPVWVWWIAGIFIAVICTLAAGAFILNLMVRARTRQLREEVDKQIKAEKKYSSVVEQSNDGIIVIQDGIIKFGNGEITRMTGLTLKETTGKAFVDFISPRYKELVSQRYARRMAGEDVPNKYEIEINRKGGEVLAVEINSSIIEYEGRPADMAIIRDITERKQAEEQLAENQARYRSLFENSNDAILLTIPDGRILAANPAACRMFGRSEQEICQLGRNGIVDISDPGLAKVLEERRRTGEFRGELTFLRGDGTRFTGEVVSSLFYDRKGNAETPMIIRDITLRKEVEEKLKQSEEKYRLLVENIPVGVSIVRSGKMIFANSRDEQITGYKMEELQSIYPFDVIYEEDRAKVAEYAAMRARGEAAPDTYEIRIIRKDGALRWLRRNVVRINWLGEPASLVLDADVTERREAEEALEKEKDYVKSILDTAPAMIVTLNARGQIIGFNHYMEQVSGYSTAEVKGKDWLTNFVPAREHKRVGETLANSIDGNITTGFVNPVLMKNGQERLVEWYSTVLKNEDGNITALLAIGQDVSERRKAEEALRESEERFSQVADSADEWIWEIDAEGVFVYCSPAVEKIVGYTPEELVGKKHYYDLYSPDVREELIKLTLEKSSEKQSLYNFANPNIHKNGSIVILDTFATPVLDKEGNLTGYRGMDKDITERMKTEEKLRFSDMAFKSIKESIVVTTMDNVITSWNDASEMIFNIESSEAIGNKLWDIITVADISQAEFEEEISQLMNTGYGRSEKLVEVKDKLIWLEVSAQLIRDENNNNAAILSIISDITERKKIEQSLSDEAIRRRILVEQSRDGIVILDQDGGVYESNKRFAEMIGYSDEEVKELHVWDWEAAASREQLLGMLNTVDEKGDHFETKHRRKDGSVYDVEISTNAALFAGQKLIFCVCRDITERKKAEAALLDEATRRRMLIEKSRDGIVIIDQDGGVYEANQRFAEMLGYSSEEIKKLHIWDWDTLIPREQLLEMLKSLDEEDNQSANEERQKGLYFETKHRRKDGSFLDVEINSNAATFAGQKLMFSVSRDITERKRAEAAVRVSEERYRTLFETMQQGVVFWGWDGKLISANKATEKILGLTLAQMKGKTPAEVIPFAIKEEGSPFPKDSYPSALALKNGKPEKDILMGVFNPRDDKYRWVVVNAMPQFKENEKEPYQVYTTFNDITQIKEIERALIQSESNLRQSLNSWEITFNSIKNAICLLALDGSIIRCNQAMNDMLGKSDEEITGRKCFEIVHGTKKHIAGCPHLKVVQSGHRETAEIAIDDKWYYVIVDPIFDSEGKVAGSIHTMDDITDRKNMEDRMIMADRLASIGELSSGIAHEVNNPLTGVIGITQLLLSREDLPDDIVKDLNIVNGEAQRAAKVVKNLLIFARKHANEAQFSSVTQAIEKVLELRAYDQKNNNIEVIRDFAPDLPHIVMDYFQIQQVFLNIIINAEFAMKEAHNGGTLTIKTEKAREMVRISFTDDGPGIPRKNLKHIFDPFFTTKEVGKGTGLGLSICHGIISQHHGNIYAKSEHGKGATFVIELPINQPEKAEEVSNG